jgi:Concanavalin A-like lectin/glucanases superfamily
MSAIRSRCIVGLSITLILFNGPAVASSLSYAKVVMNLGPVAYWRLGETAGTTAYPTVGSYKGTYLGSPKIGQQGLIANDSNDAPLFDGRNDRVIADSLTTRSYSSWAQGYTVDAWVMTTTTSAEEHILAFNNNSGGNSIALFRDEPSNRFKFRDCEGSGCVSVYSKTIPVTGKTYQLVVTVDGSNHGKLYVNGKAEASFISSKRPPHSAKFTIGAEYDCCPTPTSFWHGKIDEVAVYDHAISATQVAAQWVAGT